MTEKICAVVGVGPGIGKACAELYAAKGYSVLLMARNSDYLNELSAAIPNSTAIVLDVTDADAISREFAHLHARYGALDTVIYNAARGSFGSFLELDAKEMAVNFNVNTMGLLRVAQAVAPPMIARGRGSILVTGNTAATRGGAKFAMFAPTKGAQRLLCQSMARELGPNNVHVAYLVIDAAVDGPFARKLRAGQPDDYFIQPGAIAEAIWFLDQQPANSWTFELDLRPFKEQW